MTVSAVTATMSVAVVLAAILLWAGLEKLADLGATASTLSVLGFPAQWADGAARIVPLSEVATALGVLFAPGLLWTLVGVVTLGGAFAVAGLLALFRNERLRCNCFGPGTGGAYLGPAQILLLPAWVGGALILHYGAPNPLPLATGACLFAAVGLTITTLKTAALWRALRTARGDRRSAQEMYVWLPRH